MATQAEHIKQAERNEKLAETLARTAYHEWTVTVLFYSALHYVNAILVVSGEKIDSHGQRQTLMWKNDTTKRIYNEYRTLETLSRNGRYHLAPVGADDVDRARQNFDILKAHLRSRLGLH